MFRLVQSFRFYYFIIEIISFYFQAGKPELKIVEFRKDGRGYFATLEVKIVNGERHVIISSANVLVNNTCLPIQVSDEPIKL